MDSSTRNIRCKHSWAWEYAIRLRTLKDSDKLPAEAKRYPQHDDTIVTTTKESFLDDDYDF